MEGKVLQWNWWYLSEVLCDQRVVAKVSVPSGTSERAQLPINHIPNPLNTSPKEAPIELWRPMERSQDLTNAWFTGSTRDGTKTNGQWQPKDWGLEWPTPRKEPQTQHSTNGYKTNNSESERKTFIFFNSWCMCNGIAIWSSKWKTTNGQRNGKDIWSWGACMEMTRCNKT